MTDSICFMFKINPLDFTRENVDKFVDTLIKDYPKVFLDYEGKRVSDERLNKWRQQLFNNGVGGAISLNIYRKEYSLDFLFSKENFAEEKLEKNDFFFTLSTPEFYLYSYEDEEEKQAQVAQHTEYLLDYARLIIRVFKPEYGVCDHELTLELGGLKNHIYWINYFSPKRVQEIGLNKLVNAPVYKLETFSDGGILMMSSKVQGMGETVKIENHLGLPGFKISFKELEKSKIVNPAIDAVGEISLYFNGKLIQNPGIKREGVTLGFTYTDYIWDFFYKLIQETIKIGDLKPHTVDCYDNQLRLYFKQKGVDIHIKFGTIEENDQITILGETQIRLREFFSHVQYVTDMLIEQILAINPELKLNPEMQNFTKAKEDLRQFYRNIRNELLKP